MATHVSLTPMAHGCPATPGGTGRRCSIFIAGYRRWPSLEFAGAIRRTRLAHCLKEPPKAIVPEETAIVADVIAQYAGGLAIPGRTAGKPAAICRVHRLAIEPTQQSFAHWRAPGKALRHGRPHQRHFLIDDRRTPRTTRISSRTWTAGFLAGFSLRTPIIRRRPRIRRSSQPPRQQTADPVAIYRPYIAAGLPAVIILHAVVARTALGLRVGRCLCRSRRRRKVVMAEADFCQPHPPPPPPCGTTLPPASCTAVTPSPVFIAMRDRRHAPPVALIRRLHKPLDRLRIILRNALARCVDPPTASIPVASPKSEHF